MKHKTKVFVRNVEAEESKANFQATSIAIVVVIIIMLVMAFGE